MLANPSQSSTVSNGSARLAYDSVESYNSALHEYTRNLWMEARRQAESRAKDRATTVAPMKKDARRA
ncbi:hypothetical protein RhiJN_28821 [Ceratobasidium sp. AG-Ba]|nr:hypothetical protein RhiJN_28821 [Ceratobasidium sp. AG-Ba]